MLKETSWSTRGPASFRRARSGAFDQEGAEGEEDTTERGPVRMTSGRERQEGALGGRRGELVLCASRTREL
jgi:hypothetical protein